MTNKLKLSYE